IGSKEDEKSFLKAVKHYIEEKTDLKVEIKEEPVEGKYALPFKPALVVR
ncbi:MAG: hypothetical protein GXO00_01850, partial [Candidatus Diapherotrites archaeon]|nr:hypothetical protein [Candidatus Diapherotrites archaeon]